MPYCITLGEGELRLSPGAYLAALRKAQENPGSVFAQSFRDPRGWRRCYTGAEIVAEHYEMLHAKWAAWHPAPGKGNRARKRVQRLRDAVAECKWCGSKTGGGRFCSPECGRAYGG
jgi:hypothetical protein